MTKRFFVEPARSQVSMMLQSNCLVKSITERQMRRVKAALAREDGEALETEPKQLRNQEEASVGLNRGLKSLVASIQAYGKALVLKPRLH